MFRWIGFLVATLVAGVVIGQSVTWQKPWHTRVTNSQFFDAGNSTNTALSGGATWTGTATLNCCHRGLVVSLLTDADGTLYIEQSVDGTNWDSSIPYSVHAGTHEVHQLEILKKYARIKYTNGSSAQTYMRLQTKWGDNGKLTNTYGGTVQNDADTIVVKVVSEESQLAAGNIEDSFIVNKFGRNMDVDTGEADGSANFSDIWLGEGEYTGMPISGAETVTCSSTDADDDGDPVDTGARTLEISGLDATGLVQTETITLNGTGDATTTNTFFRANRFKVLTAGSSGTNEGTITCNHTTTTANVFSKISPMTGQSQIACYTIPLAHTGYLRELEVFIDRANSATLIGGVWVRESGAAERLIDLFSASNNDSYQTYIFGGVVLPALTDVCLRVFSISASNIDVLGKFDLVVIED